MKRVIAEVSAHPHRWRAECPLERRVGAENEERRLCIFLAQDPQDVRREGPSSNVKAISFMCCAPNG